MRVRVIAACVFLAVVIGGVFALASYALVESLERVLVEDRMWRVANKFLADRRAGMPFSPPVDLRFASDAALPDALRGLPPGMHEIELDGRFQHALIVDAGAERFALIDSESDFEQLEMSSEAALVLGFCAGVALAFGIGWALASRVIAPVTRLARAVESDDLSTQAELSSSADEIGMLARAFSDRTTELRLALQRERDFTADASHELRTPLTVMLGAAEALAARLEGHPDLHAAAERIRRNAGDMAARVSAMLSLARVPVARPDQPMNLSPLLGREVERCQALLEGKPVQIRLEAPPEVWVRAPPEVAAIAIDNLLRNACLFTEHGHVLVRLTQAALTVEDTGPGVPDGVRARLFERHAPGREAAASGSGIGLSIVKRVAERLGWDVRFEDNPGGGSRFTLVFSAR